MCTGYGRDGTSPDLIQYHKEQTVVFLMAVGRLQELCTKLQSMANYPPNTPVAIIEKAGCYNQQRTIVGTLTTISSIANQYNIQSPSTIVVGDVVNVLLDEEDDNNDNTTINDSNRQQYVTGLIQNATTFSTSSFV
jgi:siroheme synthase